MDGELFRLYSEGKITGEDALMYSTNRDVMSKKVIIE